MSILSSQTRQVGSGYPEEGNQSSSLWFKLITWVLFLLASVVLVSIPVVRCKEEFYLLPSSPLLSPFSPALLSPSLIFLFFHFLLHFPFCDIRNQSQHLVHAACGANTLLLSSTLGSQDASYDSVYSQTYKQRRNSPVFCSMS